MGANTSVSKPTQVGATTLEVSNFHKPLPNFPDRWSSTFHLRARPVSGYPIHQNTTKPRGEQILTLTSGIHHSTSIVTYHLSIALLMVSHKIIGMTRIDRKVNLHATTAPYNSYKLNAQPKYNIKQRFKLKDKSIG
jgi:hypothetical protein